MLDKYGLEGLVGQTINGYRVTRFIARGGMGIVFEAVQESLDRTVAIKVLYPHLSEDGQFRDRFEREARAAARLIHPNIVRVLDFGTSGPLHYMVMDLVEGDSLRDRLATVYSEGLTLRPDSIIAIIQQVGSALSYAHRQGYVHRDVKPGNILLTKDGRVFITDFGVVKILSETQVTAQGLIIGTPEYMAPEQSAGEGVIGPAADQYSLAVVSYELMVGRVPFQATTPVAIMRMHLTDPPPAPSSFIPWFPPQIEAILMRALSKKPSDRFPSVDEFIGSLLYATTTSPVPSAASLTQSGPITGGMRPLTASQGMASPTTPGAYAPHHSTGPTSTGPTGPTPSSTSGAPPAGGWTPPTGPPGGAPPTAEAAGQPPHRSHRFLALGGLATILIVAAVVGLLRFTNFQGGGVAATPTSSPSPTPTAEQQAVGGASPTPAEPAEDQFPVIVYAATRPGGHDSQIYIMNLDGSGQRQLTFARGHSWAPRVSPDGTKLFFSSVIGHHETHDPSGGAAAGETTNHDIFLAEIGGSTYAGISATNIQNLTLDWPSWDNGWSWSPDGNLIAFSSNQSGNYEIWTMSPDGQNRINLSNHPASDGWPVWTPDGKQIVFSSNRSGSEEIYIMDADGSDMRQLTNSPEVDDLYPAISPDGTKIAFSSGPPNLDQGEIWVMNIDGSEPTRLTHTAALNNIPSWCPDGEKIVFVSDRHGNPNGNIYMMNADGSGEPTRLTFTDNLENQWAGDTTPECTNIRKSSP